MQFKTLAPIGISTYSRLSHLKKTIEALQKNILASNTLLYIFSDAPKPGDEEIVQKVRNYIKSIEGFKEIYILEREINDRVSNNRGGLKYLLKKYGKAIFLEDDIITAPGFLQYMNDALDYYEKHQNIISITGYTPPINIPYDFSKDFFILQRFNGWGAGFWLNKYQLIEEYLNIDETKKDLNNFNFLSLIIKNGVDIPQMLIQEIEGKIDALDVKIMYQQILNNWYTIYPRKSLVQNIGHDGTGIHCGISNKFHHDTLWDKTEGFVFDENLIPNNEIIKANFDFRFKMNNFAKEFIVNDLLQQINKLKDNSFSIYGIGEVTNLLLSKLYLIKCNKKINFFIVSDTENQEILFNEQKVISVEESLIRGERNFVIVSWNYKEFMKNKLIQLSSNKQIKIITPNLI